MPSQINPNQFDDGQPVSKSALRDTLSTIKGEVEHGGFTRIAADAPERAVGDKLSESLSVKDFGALGDGVTDNSEALIRMRDYCRQDRSKLYTIYFPSGHYAYNNNTWLASIGSTRIIAYGAKFECYRNDPNHRWSRVINTGLMWQDYPEMDPNKIGILYVGSLIQSVEAGAGSITLKSTPVPGVFAVGHPVFIYGFSQQDGGWPPNARHFQYNVITNIDAETGVISLTDPMNVELLETWPDIGTFPIGPARIMSLYRPDAFIQNPYTEILGAEFLNNRARGANGNGLTLDGDTIIFRDIKHHHSDTPVNNRVRWAYNSVFLNGTEGDKNVDHCRYEDCTLYNRVTQFSGINKAEIINCQVKNENIQVSPRKLIVRGTTIEVPSGAASGGVKLSSSQWTTNTLVFEDNTVVHDGSLTYVVNNDILRNFSAAAVDGGIRVPSTNFSSHILKLTPGTLLWTNDMSVCGRITKIDYDNIEEEWILIGDWPEIGTAARVWNYVQYQAIFERGTLLVGGDIPIVRHPRALQGVGDKAGIIQFEDIYGGSAKSTWDYEVHGYVEHLTLRVKRPYRGADDNPRLAVDVAYADDASTFIRVAEVSPITVPIKIDIDGGGATGSVALSRSEAVDPMRPVRVLRLYVRNGGSPISGVGGELPLISTRLTVSSVCN